MRLKNKILIFKELFRLKNVVLISLIFYRIVKLGMNKPKCRGFEFSNSVHDLTFHDMSECPIDVILTISDHYSYSAIDLHTFHIQSNKMEY